MENQKPFMTIKEVMDLLRIKSRQTMYNWEESGYLIPIRLGTGKRQRVLYRREDVQKIIDSITPNDPFHKAA